MSLNSIAKYKSLLENHLSVQERSVLVALVRESNGSKFFVSQIKPATRIVQTNQLHAILGRLTKKEVLVKLGRAEYDFIDPDLVAHIKYRCSKEIK